MSALSLKGITKSFDGKETIRDVSLEVASGEFIVLVGPSGCGKSTILRMIAGLEEVTSGTISIDGQDVTRTAASRRGAAMVFQSYALYPHMSVFKNLSFGLKNMKYDTAEIVRRVERAAEALHLTDLLDRQPHQLSGGQRQRVAIGRSIVRDPKVFLFDEPLSNLDTELRVEMRHELANIHRRLQSTMIYVTHDQTEAMTLADRIVMLNDGRIEQVGAPLDLYNEPANVFAAAFLGSPAINLLPARIAGRNDNGAIVRLALGNELTLPVGRSGLTIGEEITLGIRPEHVLLSSRDDSIRFELTLHAVEQLGHSTFLYALLGADQPFRVKLDGQHDVRISDRIAVFVERKNVRIFDQSGQAVSCSDH